MHVDVKLAPNRVISRRPLVRDLVSLAEESDRAGLRADALVLVAAAYAVCDGDDHLEDAEDEGQTHQP